MENIHIESTESSPEIQFDFAAHKLVIKGESYPENVSKFYGPVFDALQTYLNSLKGEAVTVDVELIYFNSSSVKAIMNLFDMLENAAKSGNPITVNWHYHEEDDTILEFGEEFAEDLQHVTFNLHEVK